MKKRERQLADAQRLARLGSWHLDVETKSVVFSEEVHRILGREAAGAAMALDEFLACMHADDGKLFTESLHSPHLNQLAQDCRIIQPDGTMRYAHIRGDVVRDTEGSALQAAGMIQDVTERKLGEQELLRALEELALAKEGAEAANRAKDNFLAILSHELRTRSRPSWPWSPSCKPKPNCPGNCGTTSAPSAAMWSWRRG